MERRRRQARERVQRYRRRLSDERRQYAGADPEIEEGGGGAGHRYRVGLVRPCGVRSAPNFFRERVMHSVLGRSGGMLLYKFNDVRVLLRPSETTITTQNV